MMIRGRTVLAMILWLSVGCEQSSEEQAKLKIVVVGNGIQDPTYQVSGLPDVVRQMPLETAKGLAIWRAAVLAHDSSPAWSALRGRVEVKGVDDFGDPEYARRLAIELRSDPTVVAVIGTTASSTTRVVGSMLAPNSIPMLLPIATSGLAVRAVSDSSRLPNMFRLPPSDDGVQAPVVVWALRNIVRATKVSVVVDSMPTATAYSVPLCTSVERLLTTTSYLRHYVNATKNDAAQVAGAIHARGSDAVVLCGYASSAQQLLYALSNEFATDTNRRPTIIVTDGALAPQMDVSGQKVLLTYPLPPIDSIQPLTADISALLTLMRRQDGQSYELYAYDAMSVLAETISFCLGAGGAGRRCLSQQLQGLKNFPGAGFVYTFTEGENADLVYYVYSYQTSGGATRLLLQHRVSGREITATVRSAQSSRR